MPRCSAEARNKGSICSRSPPRSNAGRGGEPEARGTRKLDVTEAQSAGAFGRLDARIFLRRDAVGVSQKVTPGDACIDIPLGGELPRRRGRFLPGQVGRSLELRGVFGAFVRSPGQTAVAFAYDKIKQAVAIHIARGDRGNAAAEGESLPCLGSQPAVFGQKARGRNAVAEFPLVRPEVDRDASVAVGDEDVGRSVAIGVGQGGRELLPSFTESQRLPLVFVEDRRDSRPLVEEKMHVVGRVGPFSDEEVGFVVTIPVVHQWREHIAPTANRILHRRDHRLGHGRRLGELRRLGRAGIGHDKDVAEVVSGHDIEFSIAGEIGQ